MSPTPSRRPSTGGLPPIQIREHHLTEPLPSYDSSTPCFTAWARQEIVKVPLGWSASDFTIVRQRPECSFQIYDTTPQAADPAYLENLAMRLCKETSSERGYTRQPERLDVWGMSCGDGVAEGERVERCRVHSMAEIAARKERAAEGEGDGEGDGEGGLSIPELEGNAMWKRAIVVIDRSEELWDEGEGGFLAVYWDIQPRFLKMLRKAYGEGYREPEPRVRRYTRRELGGLLDELASYF